MMQSIKNSLIFVVEDNIMFLRLIKFQLQNKGYINIKSFTSGTECINNIKQNPDIVILDYSLGDMTGLDVLKKINNNEVIQDKDLYTMLEKIDRNVNRSASIISHMRQFARKSKPLKLR